MKERILAYLIDGIKASQISSIVGCSPSYISQLLADENFKKAVEEGRKENNKPADEILETKYESLEHTVVNRIQEELSGAELPALTRALDSIVRARDARHLRKHPQERAAGVQVNVVSLTLPAHAMASRAPSVVLNEQREIVAIDNKPLAPMSSEGVKGLFAAIQEKKAAALLESKEF